MLAVVLEKMGDLLYRQRGVKLFHNFGYGNVYRQGLVHRMGYYPNPYTQPSHKFVRALDYAYMTNGRRSLPVGPMHLWSIPTIFVRLVL